MRFFVVTESDRRRGNEQIKRVVNFLVPVASLLQLLYLLHSLFFVRAEAQVFLVAPEDRGLGAHVEFGEKHVEVSHSVFSSVTHDEEHAAMVKFDRVLDKGCDSAVNLNFHLYWRVLAEDLLALDRSGGGWGGGLGLVC